MASIKDEGKLWKHLRTSVIPKMARPSKWSRVESHATAIGIPDCYYVFDSVNSGWVELKHHSKAKPAELRPAQYRWIKDRTDLGAKAIWILVYDQEVDTFSLIHGLWARTLKERNSMEIWRACAGDNNWPGQINIDQLEGQLCPITLRKH